MKITIKQCVIGILQLLLITLFTSKVVMASNSCDAVTDEQAEQVAQDGLKNWSGYLFPLHTSKLSVGKVFRLYTVSPESLKNYNGSGRLSEVLSASDVWHALIISDDKGIGFLILSCNQQGNLSAVSIEAGPTAEKLYPLSQALDASTTTIRHVRINYLPKDFLLVERGNDAVVFPLLKFTGQYDNIPTTQYGGLQAANFFLLLAADFLSRANAVKFDANHIEIPFAIDLNSMATGIQGFHATLKPASNTENRLLYEVTDFGLAK